MGVGEPSEHITEVLLGAHGRRRLDDLLTRLVAEHARADDPQLLRAAPALIDQLPPTLVEVVAGVRRRRHAVVVVRGDPVARDPGPTPSRWGGAPVAATLRHDLWLATVAAQVGEPMAWAHLQEGGLILDVLPIVGHDLDESAHGSRAELSLHVDESDEDRRQDTIVLLCLRNERRVPSTVAPMGAVDLGALDLAVLYQPRFRFESQGGPKLRPILFGPRSSPGVRLDLPFTDALPGDREAAAALAGLRDQLELATTDVVLEAGDLLLIDNHRVLHGRRPFAPRHDGRDRWLRKMIVTRDPEWVGSRDGRVHGKVHPG